MQPLRFVPYLRPMVWGGRRLEQLGKALPEDRPYGESWEVSDHPVHRSVVASGPFSGQTLRSLMETHREDLLGAAARRYLQFPWLIKFLDCHDWLSVQVHPDEHAVKALWPGEGSKTETWFVLSAAPGSTIYAGLRPGVDEPALRRSLSSGTVADCLHSFAPQPGDCVFLPAGTVHAVGGGVLLAEVQQTSDATFRLYDWDRRDAHGKSRTLHIEESLRAIHWDQGPITPVSVADPYVRTNLCRRFPLVDCPYFRLQFVEEMSPRTLPGSRLQALVVIDGTGRLRTRESEEPLVKGQVWLLPAAVTEGEIVPDGRLAALLCQLPGD